MPDGKRCGSATMRPLIRRGACQQSLRRRDQAARVSGGLVERASER
jgi:hypothetical protein